MKMNILRGVVIAICCVAVCAVLLVLGVALGADWESVSEMVTPVIGLVAFLGFVVGGIVE